MLTETILHNAFEATYPCAFRCIFLLGMLTEYYI